MALRDSYTLLAPFYDSIVGAALAAARRKSIDRLPRSGSHILINGIGTGLDLPMLPAAHRYTALDLTRAMLERALPRSAALDLQWVQGDSQRLPFRAAAFDHVLLHLILAIVPDTQAALREAARVVRSGGRLFVLDKFLRRGEPAWLRRMINPLARRIATRTDVVFEDVLSAVPDLRVVEDQPALAGGWFRMITLEKKSCQDLPDSSESPSSRRGQVSQTIPASSASATAASNNSHINPLIARHPVPALADASRRL